MLLYHLIYCGEEEEERNIFKLGYISRENVIIKQRKTSMAAVQTTTQLKVLLSFVKDARRLGGVRLR